MKPSVTRTLSWRWLTGQRLIKPPPLPPRRDDQGQRQRKARKAWYAACRRRALIRHTVTVALLGTAYGYHVNPAATVRVAAIVGALVAIVGGAAAVWAISQHRHEKYERRPLWDKLAGHIKDLPPMPDRKALGMDRKAERIHLQLPPSFDAPPKLQWAVLNTVERHTGRDYRADWHHHGRPPYVNFQRVPLPAPLIPFAQMRHMLDGLDESQLILGIDGFNEPVLHDIDAEASHLLVNIGTNYGKSTYMYFLLVQLLRKRTTERVVILDRKYQSLEALDGIERVQYAREPWEINDALVDVNAQLTERKKRTGTGGEGRVIVVAEEGNQLAADLDEWWGDQPKSSGRPVPGKRALGTIVQTGRQFNMNVIMVAQHASVAAIGGGNSAAGGEAIRGNFGKVVLSAFAPRIWTSLTGEPVSQAPRLPDRKGAAVLWTRTNGSRDRMTLPLITPEEARAEGIEAQGPATAPLQGYIEPLYSLREASADVGTPRVTSRQDRGILPLKYDALRRRKADAAKRGKPWPAGELQRGVERYTEAQLRECLKLDEGKAGAA